ncbi:hypothetical protein DYBT9275_06085 [Dyadobacter sp. CECT 9275]|uniref:FecR family protein n=1 Tax=Dyadobacter helix TaxID=2822344 RepID=A0A916JJB9_9BACT|nr:FecR domain-containing protein [Dyadobacter sp. CECT 9275]CAG5018853.1 hypothetical protein DYBT9275_06085 [Dyadobacter sp. CECT 9275]
MKSQLSKETAFTYFSGNATVLQKKLIAEWLENSDNAELYFEWLQQWETSQPQFLPDESKAFENIRQRLECPEELENKAADLTESIHITWYERIMRGSKWAAVLILTAGLGAYSFRDTIVNRSYQTSYNETRTIMLDDSSEVVLNPNSRLQLLRWGFGLFNREVTLEGEAGFVVRHKSDNQPFTVHTADAGKVTVLGTEFFVYTRKKGTRVVLNKGKVQISSHKAASPLDMKPGEKASISQDGKISIETLSKTELADPVTWKQHRFQFDHTSLRDAAVRLNEVFGTNIVVEDPALSDREVTGTFNAQQADELLVAFSEILDLTVQVQKDKIYLIPGDTSPN